MKRLALAVPVALVAFASCGSDKTVSPPETSIAASPEASMRVADLRGTFAIPASEPVRFSDGREGIVTSLAGTDRVQTPADVVLPTRAGGTTRIVDRSSKLGVSFALKGASDAALAVGSDLAIYRGAYETADLVHRVHAEGTEDYIAFDRRPAREEIAYDVDVSQAAGLRLVDGTHTLELLDATGAPRLRVTRPYVVDAQRQHHEASLTVVGCAYDRSGAAPWGRPVTPPGARSCELRVSWSGVAYPALVDPGWNTTGSASKSRQDHTSTLLDTGYVLVTGGDDTSTTWDVAELYNESGTGSFAVTGQMKSPRRQHTATKLNNGTVVLIGGHTGTISGDIAAAEIYTPATGAFAFTGSLTLGAREQHTATLLLNGNVLVAGGVIGSTYGVATAEIFNGATFSATGSGTARYLHTATRLTNGNVLMVGGSGPGVDYIQTAQLFTGSGFTNTGSLITARREHTATLLNNGNVVVIGGTGAEKTAEIYSGGSFANTLSPPAESRLRHHATLLDSGKVLVAHGFVSNNYSELFDPITSSFAYASNSVKVARQWPKASLLPSGNVLVTGGPSTTAERFEVLQAGSATVCKRDDDCRSGSCNDGVCCSTTCTGACKTCTAGTGACTAVTNGTDADTCTGANICNAAGSCKLILGQACNLGTSCASGYCADGVCCNKACSGGCDRCDATGTCNIVVKNTAGENPSCGAFTCDGVNPGCPGSCTNDGDCVDGQYCSANGTCQPKKSNGLACNPAIDCKDPACHECTGAACVDGVCCDTTCTGLCQACSAALKQNGADGKCGPAKEGTNPHNDSCPVTDPSTCGSDGKCSGSGGCRAYYPAGTSCGASQCTATTNKAVGYICNGGGSCVNDTIGVSCFDYLCDPAKGSCPNSCTTDAQCSPTAYCNTGSCVPKESNGGACTNEKQCASGLCVDGFCCNSTCDGQCEACDVQGAEGTCAPLTGTPHNERPKCAAADPSKPCATATCDGDTRDKCAGFVGPEVRCGAATCANGKATLPGNCHKGECASAEPVSCGVYACGPTACKTSCETNADCTQGNLCDSATKHCIAQATCDGDHTTTGANGQKQDCSPYKCQGDGTCRQKCESIDHCVAPTACDPASGKCVPPPPAEGGDSGGCSTSPASSASPFGWLFALAAIAATRRRRPSA